VIGDRSTGRAATRRADRRRGRALARGIAAALGMSLLGDPIWASAGSPNGSEFQVNTYTTSGQYQPQVAGDSAGNFDVVWASNGSAGSDTSSLSVQGQRYDASGSPIGGQFQINTYTTNAQDQPQVASDSAGNFVVVWASSGGAGTDTSGYSVQGQRYDATASPVGGQFQVNSYTTNDQDHPSVASDSAGDVVVVWQGFDASGVHRSVAGQRYDPSGSQIGGEFQVNTSLPGPFEPLPSVASDHSGNFVVAWSRSYGSVSSSVSSIRGQRYNASGSPIGGEFQVNTYTTGGQSSPSVASDAAGDFVVVWASNGSAGTDTSGYSVQGQRYNASGSPVGGQFQVNTYTLNGQYRPQVASDSFGDFVVVWQSDGSAGSDTSYLSVQGQRYSANGAPSGGQFQVNTFTASTQYAASVASDSKGGNFVVAWASLQSAGTDTSGFSVEAQRYLPEPSLAQSVGPLVAMLVVSARARRRGGPLTRRVAPP